ncbi:YrzE family protein [Agromyces sp. Soil535]|uniref:YrzE family protein n=1 Tax=Agromyces sp. Soil535 TaxID=1736390 RepID=UPI0007012F1D|nr:YrzE family protein [Agromyces sp. Soil535]KRE21010.1 hypothetical protein ASG80_15200 [Agromyces sp. Soil535]
MSSTTPGSDPDHPHDADAAEGEQAPVAEPVSAAEPGDTAPQVPVPSAPEPAAAFETSEPEPVAPVVEPEPAATVEPEPVAPLEPEPVESPDAATAQLDAAVERATAAPAASDYDEAGEAEPAAAEVPHETYMPAATVAAGAATLAPQPEAVAPSAAQTVYVQAPKPPRSRGNRGFGVLVALIGTVLFALLYAGIAYLLLLGQGDAAEATSVFTQFVTRPVYWVPIVACFVGFALLAAIVNRGAWWYYAVFGLLVGVLVYFSYVGAALLTVEAWTLTVDEAREFIGQRWLDPFAIVAAVVAREIPIWFGGWIAARGRTVTERNRLALEAYDRELAAGPQPQR